MRVNVVRADAVVVGRIVGVLPPRRLPVPPAGLERYADGWRPIRVEASDVLFEREPAAGRATRAGSLPRMIDVAVVPGLPVDPAAAAATRPAARAGTALPGLAQGSRYVFFLERVISAGDAAPYALTANTAGYAADDRTVAGARDAVQVDRWPWGPPVAGLRACFIPCPAMRVERTGMGDVEGAAYVGGWTVVRNVGPTVATFTVGGQWGPPWDERWAGLDVTAGDGRAWSERMPAGGATVLSPGRCAFVGDARDGRHEASRVNLQWVVPGDWSFRASAPVSLLRQAGPGEPAGVLTTLPERVYVPGRTEALREGARRTVYVLAVSDAGRVKRVRDQLLGALGRLPGGQVYNVVVIGDGGRLATLADQDGLAATPESAARTRAFLDRRPSPPGAALLPAITAGLTLRPQAMYVVTDGPVPDKGLAAAVARLNDPVGAAMTVVLLDYEGRATVDALQGLFETTGCRLELKRSSELTTDPPKSGGPPRLPGSATRP